MELHDYGHTLDHGGGCGKGHIWHGNYLEDLYVGFTDSLPHFELLKFVHKIE